MEQDWNKLIERYLGGELSSEGIEAFEFELSLNPALRSELDLHRMIRESVFRSADRLAIQQIGTKYHFRLKLKKWLMFTSVVVTVATTIALAATMSDNTKAPTRDNNHIVSETNTDNPLAEPVDDASLVNNDVAVDPVSTPFINRNVPRRTFAQEIKPAVSEMMTEKSSELPAEVVSVSNINETLPKEIKPEAVKVKEDKKQRLVLSKGLVNPMYLKEGPADSPMPSGAHWTLGNYMIYATDEGITFHNFLTDDVIVVGRTPKDQLKPPATVPKDEKGIEKESKKDKGKIYLQNY